MSGQRRDTKRIVEPVDRVWNIYADELGIPKAGLPESSEPFRRQSEALRRRPRHPHLMATKRAPILIAIAFVALTAGAALWLRYSRSIDTAGVPVSAVASAPAGERDGMVRESTPDQRAGDGVDAVAPAVRARSETVDPARPDFIYRINFDFGSDSIDGEARRTLDRIVAVMDAHPDWRIAIEGHTDGHGALDYNRTLSQRRAQVVKAYLQAAGVGPERLKAVGFGASRPMAPNDAAGSVLNRRVEVRRQ